MPSATEKQWKQAEENTLTSSKLSWKSGIYKIQRAFFTLKSNRKKYLIYTENKKDEKGNVEIYTSELTENDKGAIILAGVEDEMVWNDIKQVLVNISKGLF